MTTTREHVTASHTATADRAASVSRQERSERTAVLLTELTEPGCRPDTPAGRARRDQVVEEVVHLNLRVARAVAARYAGRGVAVDDLEQTASEALLKAVHRFDGTGGRDFLSYAVPTIRGELQRYFRDRGWMIRPPRSVQERQQRLNRFIDAFRLEHGREPSEQEVCTELDIDHRTYDDLMAAFGAFRLRSLDQPLGDDGARTLGHLHEAQAPLGGELLDPFAAAEARAVLRPVLRRLEERQRRMLYLRFVEERSQSDIAAELGGSQASVSRELRTVVARVRADLTAPQSAPRSAPEVAPAA